MQSGVHGGLAGAMCMLTYMGLKPFAHVRVELLVTAARALFICRPSLVIEFRAHMNLAVGEPKDRFWRTGESKMCDLCLD